MVPPSRQESSVYLIPKLYDRNERKYVSPALTDGSYNLQRHLLEAVEFLESQTGVNISEELINILEDW